MAGDGHNSSIRLGDADAEDLRAGDTYTYDRNPWVEIDLDIGFILTLSLSDTVTITDNSSQFLSSQSSIPRKMHQYHRRRI